MKSEKLLEVINHNLEIQKKALELNIRAGQELFHIITRSEIEGWLKDRLHGAKRVSEIKDFNELLFPPLDKELVEKVIADNPDSVTIESATLSIEYGKDYYGNVYARTNVEEDFVRNVKSEAIILPSGRAVEIVCRGYSAETFAELVDKLENSRIKKSWSEARRQNETSWITDPEKIGTLLARIGNEIEITRANNGRGEPIYGTIGLRHYASGYKEVMLFLADTKEKAQEETQRTLENLFRVSVQDELIVPKEEPWQIRNTGWYNSWSMTDLGKTLQSRYEFLLKEYSKSISVFNVIEKINTLKTEIQKSKTEIGKVYGFAEKVIEETELNIESQINALDDEDFVEPEIYEIQNLISEAKDRLRLGEYEEVKPICDEAIKILKKMQDRILVGNKEINSNLESSTKIVDVSNIDLSELFGGDINIRR
ncbi:MAG TPA: hypothetical protein PKL50_02710 [bacterium]|nr:hypothetical protein [bacterium]HQI03327.1 hypothetical protein [bacterium]